MSDFVWTGEQNAVLAATSRITLVRAGPGSGKTKVFVELLNRHVDAWKDWRSGVAALSFTNVAQDEIAKRLGGRLSPPHFVGTLDSFFLRFVVGPFGHLAGLRRDGSRLIPSPLDEELRKPSVTFQTKDGRPNEIPLFRISPCGGTEEDPQFVVKPYAGRAERIPAGDARTVEIRRMKRTDWSKAGRITHADSHYLAASAICGPHGTAVRSLLARRFPVILVDELQDTGHFWGRALLTLLAEPTVKAVLVGDEDQRIFGFSGTDRRLFTHVAELDKCAVHPLRTTQRCTGKVAAVASALSRSSARVEPKKEAAAMGTAVLLVHRDPKGSRSPRSIREAVDLCVSNVCENLAVLVRRRDEKRTLLGLQQLDNCPLKGRGPRALHRAVTLLIDRRGNQAAHLVESCLGSLLLEDESPQREDLMRRGIDSAEFRRRARKIVMQATQIPLSETWGQWSARMKELLDGAASDLGGSDHARRLGSMFRSSSSDKPDLPRNREATSFASPRTVSGEPVTEILTVHEAKGREFDAVLLYCSKPSRKGGISTCPSATWWSSAPDSEEREVAFVASTRAKHMFILALHEESYSALKSTRPQFIALFESVKELDESAASKAEGESVRAQRH